MPDGGNPFFVISETNQLPYSVRVEDTDSLSIGREYRLTVLRWQDFMIRPFQILDVP